MATPTLELDALFQQLSQIPRESMSPDEIKAADELTAIYKQKKNVNMPGVGNMPGVSDPATGGPIPLPGMPPAQKPFLLRTPLNLNSPIGRGPNDPTSYPPNIEGSGEILELGADLGRAGNRMLQPGTEATPRIENITGGLNDATSAVFSKAWPLAAAAAIRYPLPALAGTGSALVGKGVVEGSARLSDRLLDTNFTKDYPESLKLTGDVAAMLAGAKGFEKVQTALTKAAAKSNTSTELLHRVLSPEINDVNADKSIRAAIPIIKEYSPDFVATNLTRAQIAENPMMALGRKLSGRSGSASTHPSRQVPLGPQMNPKNLRSGSVVEEFVDSSDRAQDDIFRAFESLVQPWDQRGAVINGDSVANAMQAAFEGESVVPQDVGGRMLRLINSYRGRQIPLRQAINELRDSNAGSNGFFRKNLRGQNAAVATNAGDAAVETARGDALRDAIYQLLDSDNAGRAPAQLMKLWGQINSVKHMAYRRLIPSYKGAEGSGVLGSILNIGRAGRAAYQGNPAAAAAAASQASNIGGKSIDDAMLKAILEFGGEAKRVSLPEQIEPIALLERGPIRTEAPDTSGPTGRTPRYGSGMGTATGQRTLPAAESPIRYADPVPPLPDASGQTSGNYPRPGAGYSPSRIDQRLLESGNNNPDLRTGGARVTPPGPNSYPGQEPERGLYQTGPNKFSDPFPGLSGHDRSRVLQQLKADGKASIVVDGIKRMWKLNEDGSIRRLR